MRILLAPDSFKESLSAKEVCLCMEEGILSVLPDADIQVIPMADGGEGTIEALLANKGQYQNVKVHDALMRPISSGYGLFGQTAIIEMAKASGLELIKPSQRNPLITTTYGTGELIKDALDQGCTKLIIAIGGSATNDGGAGMLEALGVKFLDGNGLPIKGGGLLSEILTIDTSSLDHRLSSCEIIVACDVTNPLLGKQGASHVFAPQKGASTDTVAQLEQNLTHFASITHHHISRDYSNRPGAGAAGGLGFGLMAYLGATVKSGFQVISDWLELEKQIQTADLIFTGEGKIDLQSRYGKVPHGIGQLAKKYGKPVICIAGNKGHVPIDPSDFGITNLYTLVSETVTPAKAMTQARTLLPLRTAEGFREFLMKF